MKWILTLCLAMIATTAFSQRFENIILDSADGSGSYAPSEPSVAISFKDRDNIVAGAILDKVYVTHDGGKTWSKNRLESSMGVFGDPVVISDKKGDFFYFHLSDPTGKAWKSEEILDRIVVQESKDGGDTWSDGEAIGFNHPKDQDKEWAVADPKSGNLHVTWTQFDEYGSDSDECKSNILWSESSNGKKWSDPVVLSEHAGDCRDGDQTTEGAVPAVGPEGELFAAWSYNEKIYLDRSYDKGKRWLRFDIEVADQPGGWEFDVPGIQRCNGFPILISDNSDSRFRGALYLNWSDQRNGTDDTDIWFSRSFNYGDMWQPPTRVNDDEPGSHQFLSWMALDNTTGFIYILYYDRRAYDYNKTDVYLAYSIDGGATFTNVKISEKPFIPDEEVFFGDYTNISAHDGRIVPIWARMDNGKTSIVTTIIDQEDLIPTQKKGKKKKK